ncbi:MAG TPA: four helix bundle protein [Verrucomicrobiae bacterium]|nr:four helix bundle protein [Verrucomicrobiae bacterium]
MRVADYKDLRVYQLAFETTMQVFELTKQFPHEERYALTDQMRRSSRSVCSNIAEAWRKRRYEAAFASKLSDADAEAAETETHLSFAFRCGYLKADQHAKLKDAYDHICRQMATMIRDAASWCGNDRFIREEFSAYFATSRSDAHDASTL